MSAAYGIIQRNAGAVELPRLPITAKLVNNETITLQRYNEGLHMKTVMEMLNHAIEEGMTYPQLDCLNADQFKSYYLSHECFVATIGEAVVGSFYIKPNFPGRCSHICNGGFLVNHGHRGKGVGKFMGQNYILLARDLGYKASLFNLVFVTNEPSLKLWRALGFKEVGRLPKAGLLKNNEYVDAIQFYYDLTL